MKKGRFLWSAYRITEKQKAGKARNIKEKQLKNSRSTVSKQLVALRSSASDNSSEYRKKNKNPENPVFSGLSLYSAKEKNAAASGEKADKMQRNEWKKPWKNAEGTMEE